MPHRRRSTRMGLPCAVVVLLVIHGTIAVPVPAVGVEVGTLEAAAWNCPADTAPAADDPAALAAVCTQPADGATFALTAGDLIRRRITAGGQPVAWRAVVGPFTLILEKPSGAEASVLCTADEATWTPVVVTDGAITGEVPVGGGLSCRWYVLGPVSSTPSPTESSAAVAGPPPEVVVGEARFLLDRPLALDVASLTSIDAGPPAILAREVQPPYSAVYIASPDSSSDVIRYLPEQPGPEGLCPAEIPGILKGGIRVGESMYAFAGVEKDLPVNQLVSVGTVEEYLLRAEYSAPPWSEVFVFDTEDAALLRYVALDPQGVPIKLASPLLFMGQTFQLAAGEETASVAGRTRIGCAGPFPLWADLAAAQPPYSRLYAGVGDKHFVFDAVDAPPMASPTAVVDRGVGLLAS